MNCSNPFQPALRRACALLLPLWLVAACISDSGPGAIVEGEMQVERVDATSVDLTVTMPQGLLSLAGSATTTLELVYTSNEALRPQLDESREGDTHVVALTQPAYDDLDEGGEPLRNTWSVGLAGDLLWDLSLTTGLAKIEADLDDVRVRSLTAEAQREATIVGIDGVHPELESVSLRSTTGELWLNLEGSYSALRELALSSTSGRISLMLLGDLERDLVASVTSTTGELNVHVPPDIAVTVVASTASGPIVAGEGFRQDGHAWTSGPPNAPVTLTLELTTTSGTIAFRFDETG